MLTDTAHREVLDLLAGLANQRVRVTAANGFAKAGVITAHPIRGRDEVDVRMDGLGGVFHSTVRIEALGTNGRYFEYWTLEGGRA